MFLSLPLWIRHYHTFTQPDAGTIFYSSCHMSESETKPGSNKLPKKKTDSPVPLVGDPTAGKRPGGSDVSGYSPGIAGYEGPSETSGGKLAETTGDEIYSDGSASAFEGTEAIDSHDLDDALSREKDQLDNDPSGRSNY